ncbi:MAG TPA: ATP-binding protein, partial [Thermoanaerobaculia bacterium]
LELKPGDVVSAKGSPVKWLTVLLSGRIVIRIDRGAGLRQVTEWKAGDVTGVLPYSRLVSPPGDAIAEEPTTILAVDREHLPALIRECQEITSILVHKMLDRARMFTTSQLHDEKLASLGKLSAGLAHELNNPAAAIERSAAVLGSRMEELDRAARALGDARLDESQFAAIDAVRQSCMAAQEQGVRSPIEQAHREEAIADWLSDHGLDTSAAEPLSETAVTLEALDRLAGVVEGPALNAALRWAAAGCSLRVIASEIREASSSISGLVVAVKGFTHMDQAAAAEPVDLTRSLANTVAVLKAKARAKSIAVAVEIDPDLPRVRGFAGELNQIWANLIDNALDAVPPEGSIEVLASREGQCVVVRVVDNGKGIPAEIRDRIFEPFFTTKPQGQGTGLGLDIVRRLVRNNDGQISCESRPGRTEFRVSLPVAEAGAARGEA